MEEVVLEVINCLDSRELDDIEKGIVKLDAILTELLPYIVQSRNNPLVPRNAKLSNFISLQDSFQYNIASHLIQFYRLVWEDIEHADINIILTCNRLLQGLLLLHPESRTIFNRPNNMNTMLNFLQIEENGESKQHLPIEVTISFISTLIHILLKNLSNFRTFEDNDGCKIVIKKLQLSSFPPHKDSQPSNQQKLKFKIIEFLIFYMTDEYESPSTSKRRTIQEKSELFRPYFPEIDNLVENLNDLKAL